MNHETLKKMITTSAENVKAQREALFLAAGGAIAAKQELDDARLALLVSGSIDGKNAEIREAQMAEFLKPKTEALRAAEKQERAARHKFDQAQTDYEAAKYLIRLVEASHE
jgi:hypothetical protein